MERKERKERKMVYEILPYSPFVQVLPMGDRDTRLSAGDVHPLADDVLLHAKGDVAWVVCNILHFRHLHTSRTNKAIH